MVVLKVLSFWYTVVVQWSPWLPHHGEVLGCVSNAANAFSYRSIDTKKLVSQWIEMIRKEKKNTNCDVVLVGSLGLNNQSVGKKEETIWEQSCFC